MVALKGKAVESFLARPTADLFAVLIYGPDAGLVRERTKRLAAAVLGDAVGDPFRSAELGQGDLLGDPARLHDEAAALSLVGGRRFLRITDCDDKLAGAAAAFLESRALCRASCQGRTDRA